MVKPLHNLKSNQELRAALATDNTPRTTLSFYQYFQIENPQEFRDELYQKFAKLGVLGRIYLADEGINAQMRVPSENFELFRETLYQADPALNGIRLNVAIEDDGKSFWVLRMKVRIKIVADGIDDPTFSVENKGAYLTAPQVNQLIDDPDTVFVDMRNYYEYEVGHFQNAIEIPSDTFKEQLPMAAEMLKELKGRDDKNIVMYCTGGIRCEKATAYMIHNGFNNVYHVEGGVIEYARKAKELGLESKFKGKNFVFDERFGERITDDVVARCHQCGQQSDQHTNCANDNCHRLFIQCQDCASQYANCCSGTCQQIASLPESERYALRKTQTTSTFDKARSNRVAVR
jgi:UPF0176 protein